MRTLIPDHILHGIIKQVGCEKLSKQQRLKASQSPKTRERPVNISGSRPVAEDTREQELAFVFSPSASSRSGVSRLACVPEGCARPYGGDREPRAEILGATGAQGGGLSLATAGCQSRAEGRCRSQGQEVRPRAGTIYTEHRAPSPTGIC